MSDEIEQEQSTEETTPDPEPEQPAAAAETPVAAENDGWHTELALESQRYVWLVTAPDGSKHVAHSEDELEQLKAAYGK